MLYHAEPSIEIPHFNQPNLRAVFCNYVLDVLPATVIRRSNSGIDELQVRTHLVGNSSVVAQHTDLSFEQIAELANAEDPVQRRKLLPLVTLLELETAFQPIDRTLLPCAENVLASQEGIGKTVLNYGALDFIKACLKLLDRDGIMLINDYGPVDTDDVEIQIVSQRFGPTIALGINFPFLEDYFSSSDWGIVVPDNDAEAPIHARLIALSDTKQPVDFFRSRFGTEGQQYFERPIIEARGHAQAGRKNEALEAYKTALTRNRSDWFAMGEIAEYVGLQLLDPAAGLELAKEAIKLNPWYSAWLWNVLGDCLFCRDRFSDAHEAYLQAYRINPRDARANLNLAFSHVQLSRYDEALYAIARGLAHDPGGLQREQLLEKQRQILSQISIRSLGEQERLMRRALSQQ